MLVLSDLSEKRLEPRIAFGVFVMEIIDGHPGKLARGIGCAGPQPTRPQTRGQQETQPAHRHTATDALTSVRRIHVGNVRSLSAASSPGCSPTHPDEPVYS